MSSESPPVKKPRKLASPRAAESTKLAPSTPGFRLVDGLLLIGFLALTFLLGAFPLKDTDFWWHLKAGDQIRQTGSVPIVDTYTFTVAGKPWIDLHWIFQVAISLIYERGGVPALTLAKCVVTTLSVFLLVTAKRREWPLWAMLIGWLPALLVLGGRMYVRPETLTLLYLSVFLAVLFRVDRRPMLAFLLPLVQIAWVNTQGLFVFGPILLGAALIDAATRPGAFSQGRKSWWLKMGAASLLTGIACLVNPYGLTGALYPLQLAQTMGNPIFRNTIAELTPIPLFIQRDGLSSLPLRLHLLTMILGALSFLLPIVWLGFTRLWPTDRGRVAIEGPPAKISSAKKTKTRKSNANAFAPPQARWHLSAFRLLLFGAFSWLSWQATRNSHQFAAVVGTITAWNFGEWAWALSRRSPEPEEADNARSSRGVVPRIVTAAMIGVSILWVASGSFYAQAREGRTIGLGEQPLWYPHEAIKFSGQPGMPERFVSFHIGHASLYVYHFAPERKVFADARLELMGEALYRRYLDLQKSLDGDTPEWSRELDEIGRPVVLVDLEHEAKAAATLLTSRDWRCVWLDPVAAVFVHASYDEVVRTHQVDLVARHFHPEPKDKVPTGNALLVSAKGLRNLASSVVGIGGPERGRALALIGMDQARMLLEIDPQSAEGWKLLAQFEVIRDPLPNVPLARFRQPFDAVFDLSTLRAIYQLKRAREASPDDFLSLLLLQTIFEKRGMTEAQLPLLDAFLKLSPISSMQSRQQAEKAMIRDALRAKLGSTPDTRWGNLNELGQVVNVLLSEGRVGTAAEVLERASASETRTWEETDRIATFRLHLGEPARARALWQGMAAPPKPALREARVALTHLVEGSFEAARESFRAAISIDPNLFEAYYGLAVLEQDSGRAAEALEAGRKAAILAPNDISRSAAQSLVAFVTPYARSPIAVER